MDYKRLADLIFPNVSSDISYYENLYPERLNKFVTRFAPSPTGFLHIGSLYTAYISSIMAKQNDGVMILRIEDTDSAREIESAKEAIIRDLNNFDINIDEGINSGNYGPYIQSDRVSIYHSYVKYLIENNLAYPCFLTEEEISDIRKHQEINKERIGIYGKYACYRDLSFDEIKKKIESNSSYVIRLKSPGNFDERFSFEDLIKGKIEFPSNDLDIVLLKSDMVPTYHLAHVIDDHLMRVTHVIRGEEWLSSVPIHYQLFRIFNFKIPKYAHISPITKRDGNTVRKLSKRKDKECLVSYYEELGIPSEVIKLYFNTLINADYEAWYNNPSNEFKFTFKKMPVGGSLFDYDKLINISKTYFSRLTAKELLDKSLGYYKKYDIDFYNVLNKNLYYSINMLNIERNVKKPRKDISSYSDIKKMYWYFFDEYFYKIDKCTYNKCDIDVLKEYINTYDPNDDNDTWYQKIKDLSTNLGYSSNVKEYNLNPTNYKGHIGDVCEMIRVAITSLVISPDIYEIMHVMGYDRVIKRINGFIDRK